MNAIMNLLPVTQRRSPLSKKGAMSGLMAGALALVATGHAFAQGSATGRVVEYGILASAEGKPEFVQKTDRIPLRKGLRFGFCAELQGLDAVNGLAGLSEQVRHPLLVQPNGIEANGWNVPRTVQVVNGRARWCGGHTFREDWDLVPGTWRFVIGDSAGDLVVQEFKAVGDGK
jgi:hypothetical protein